MLKVKLGKREIEKKKKLAGRYKGISYDAAKNQFVVRYRQGTDLNGKPIYVLPIKSYNDFDEAVKCWSLYKEMVENGMGRHKKITFERIHNELKSEKERLIDEIKKAEDNSPAGLENPSKIATIDVNCNALSLIQRGAPVLYTMDLRKIKKGDIQKYYDEIYKNGVKGVKSTTLNERLRRIANIIGDKYELDRDLFKIKLREDDSKKDVNKVFAENKVAYSVPELHKLYVTAIQRETKRENNVFDRTRLLLLINMVTGARIGELLNLTVEKVVSKYNVNGYEGESRDGERIKFRLKDFNFLVIYRQRHRYNYSNIENGSYTKTSQSNRIVPIFQWLYDEIQKYIIKYNLAGKDKLFFSSFNGTKNKSVRHTTVWNDIIKLEKNAGIEHIESRANHVHRDDLITVFEEILGVRENTVRLFVGHKGRVDAHRGYINFGDEAAMRIAAKEFLAAQASYFFSIAYNYDTDKMIKLFKKYKEEIDDCYPKGITAVKKNLWIYDETMKFINYKEVFVREMKGEALNKVLADIGVGVISTSFDNFEYEIYKEKCAVWLNDYRNAPRATRLRFKTFEEYLDEQTKLWLNNKAESSKSIVKFDKTKEQVNIPEKDLKEFYESEQKSEYRNNNSWEDFLADINDENDNIVKVEFLNYLKSKNDTKNSTNL